MKLTGPLSCHPCRVSYNSVKNYIEKSGYTQKEIDNLLIEGAELFNNYSQVLKSPGTGISKTPFYTLKGMFAYFLVVLAVTIDEVSDYKLEILGRDQDKKLYRIKFTVSDGRSFIMNVQDTIDQCQGVFEFLSTGLKLKGLSKEYTPISNGLTVQNAKERYETELLAWCNKHSWFFTIFYYERYLLQAMRIIMRGTCYMVNICPKRNHVKWMLHLFDVDAWFIDKDNTVYTREVSKIDIRKAFSDMDIKSGGWKLVEQMHWDEYMNGTAYSTFATASVCIKGFDKSDIPVYPPMVREHNQSLIEVLNSRHKETHAVYTDAVYHVPNYDKGQFKFVVIEDFIDADLASSTVFGIFDSYKTAQKLVKDKEAVWDKYEQMNKQPEPEYANDMYMLESLIPDFMFVNHDTYKDAIVHQLYTGLRKKGHNVTYNEVEEYYLYSMHSCYIGHMTYEIKKIPYTSNSDGRH